MAVRRYAEEFKRDAVALVASGMTQKQVSKDLGVSKSTLGSWILRQEMTSRGFTPPESAEEDVRTRAMLKRVRELEMENEVLRRAAAYLSQEHIRPK